MISEKQFRKEIDITIANAIREDIGDGDHSSLACIPEEAQGKAKLLVKDEGIIAGVEFAKQVFDYVDPGLSIDVKIADGTPVKYGDIAFYVSGNSQSILKAERLVLNAMQRMSAIATKTNAYDFCGGITKAIETTVNYLEVNQLDLKIIVEARDLDEIKEILATEGVYRILIDNFNYEDTRKAVALIGDQCLTESSGGITLDTARHYAECGVDYISSGALTHSVYNMDLSLKAV